MIKELFRKKALRKNASGIATGMLPLSSIKTAAVLVDAEAPDRNECVQQVREFFGKYAIEVSILFADTRKYEKNTAPETDPAYTLLRKNLNWYGKPKGKAFEKFMAGAADLYLSLREKDDFAEIFTASSYKAKYKIGGEISRKIFDITVTSGKMEGSCCDRFRTMAEIMESVR